MPLAPLPAPTRTRRRRLPAAAAVAFVIALLALICLPATASADTPFRLPNEITDKVQALDPGQRTQVQQSIDDLYDKHKVRLWVVFVADFGGLEPGTWADRTASASSLGDRDILLAIATEDRSYYLSLSSALKEISQSELDKVRIDSVEPALHQQDWAGATIAAASGLSDAMSSSNGGSALTTLLVGGGVVAVGAGGVVLYSRKKRGDRVKQGTAAAREIDPTDTRALAALPIPALDARSKEVLVEIDNALQTSAEELDLAKGEFGEEAARPFDTAYTNAKDALAQAFTIRQRLDDNVPETPEQQRDLLVTLISNCGNADRELDARVAEFDSMRDLLINAPDRLDALTRDMVDLTARVPNSEATLTKLTGEFPAPALAPVKDNATMAKDQLSFADNNISAGRDAVALPAGKQGPAVGAIRAAEGALAQARSLLDGIDHADADIRNAMATLPAAIADVRNDIAAAAELAAHGGPPLLQAKAAAEAALTRAEAAQHTNPLGAFNDIVTADTELDKLLGAASDHKRDVERLQQQLAQALTAARSQVGAANDFVSTRRGAVDAEARTRLSEAQRHLDEAQRIATSNPSNALAHAQAAADLGARALSAAQSDVSQWQSSRSSGSGGNAGAVLGGILIDSMLRGGFSAGSRGGRWSSGGGRSPGSFGGAGSSRRIGGGGRF